MTILLSTIRSYQHHFFFSVFLQPAKAKTVTNDFHALHDVSDDDDHKLIYIIDQQTANSSKSLQLTHFVSLVLIATGQTIPMRFQPQYHQNFRCCAGYTFTGVLYWLQFL